MLRVGEHVIDQHILKIAGVAKDLWRPSDFSSNVVVLKLMSTDTLRKIEVLRNSNQRDFSDVEAGVLSLTLYFCRLHLHSVKSNIPERHRVPYLWISTLWMMCLSNASNITKRNLIA